MHGLEVAGKQPWIARHELEVCWGEPGSIGRKQQRLAGDASLGMELLLCYSRLQEL